MRGETRLIINKRGSTEEVFDFLPVDPAEVEVASVRNELEAFAAAVSGGPPYPLSLEEAVHGTAVLEAIVLSSISGETVVV